MKILTRENISKNNINIFVDASILQTGDNSYIGCPGCAVIVDEEPAEYVDYVKLDSTNSRSELLAIQLGVSRALEYRHLGLPINLFSDSKVCIYSLSNWIYNWSNNMLADGILYGSSGKPVANQDILIYIINTILSNNLSINLFHQKGHVNTKNKDSMTNARKVFNVSNGEDIDMEMLDIISDMNNYVDYCTKETLSKEMIKNRKLNKVVSFALNKSDVGRYAKLIERRD